MGFWSNVFEYGWTAGSIINEAEREADRICKNIKTTIIDDDEDEKAEKNDFSNDMRIMKFEKMIENIVDLLNRDSLGIHKPFAQEEYYLAFIYDYDELNDYGKVIVRQNYKDIDFLQELSEDWELKKDEIMGLINACKRVGVEKSYSFIFWAIMILTVDNTKKEAHLSLICDFAKILGVSDEEMLDIMKVIKMVYQEAEDRIEFLTESIPRKFSNVLVEYKYHSGTGLWDMLTADKDKSEQGVNVWEKYEEKEK